MLVFIFISCDDQFDRRARKLLCKDDSANKGFCENYNNR